MPVADWQRGLLGALMLQAQDTAASEKADHERYRQQLQQSQQHCASLKSQAQQGSQQAHADLAAAQQEHLNQVHGRIEPG